MSEDAMRHAIELGINWIDTAAVYGLGHSEEVVGRFVRSLLASEPRLFSPTRSHLGRAQSDAGTQARAQTLEVSIRAGARKHCPATWHRTH